MPENKSTKTPNVVFIGGAHIDESARLQDALQPGESNRVSRSTSVGGVACNAALAAAQQASCHLIAAMGRDQTGLSIEQQLQKAGIHCQFVYPEQASTGRYTAVLDAQGELIIGLSSTEIAETLTADTIAGAQANIEQASVIAFDTNLSSSCLSELCRTRAAPKMIAIGVSPVKTMRLREIGEHIDCLFTNRFEAAMLSGCPATATLTELSNALLELNFKQHVITDGAAELLIKSADSAELLTPLVRARHPGKAADQRSVNGAGDALAGATIAGLAMDLSLQDSVKKLGLAAAANIIYGQQND